MGTLEDRRVAQAASAQPRYVSARACLHASGGLGSIEFAACNPPSATPFVFGFLPGIGKCVKARLRIGEDFLERSIWIHSSAVDVGGDDNSHRLRDEAVVASYHALRLNRSTCHAAVPAVMPLGGMDALPPIAPILYCSQRAVLFHPPCPRCGTMLDDCRDEALLARYGLQTTSRYVYCPACGGADPDNVVFFVADDHAAPPVAGLSSLLRNYATAVVAAPNFPCHDCTQRAECYADDAALAQRRISAYSFYSFHAYAIDDPGLPLRDYVDLLGGMAWSDLERRIGFAGDPHLIASLREIHDDEANWRAADPLTRFDRIVMRKLKLFGRICQTACEVSSTRLSDDLMETSIFVRRDNGVETPHIVCAAPSATTPTSTAENDGVEHGRLKVVAVEEHAEGTALVIEGYLESPQAGVGTSDSYIVDFGEGEGFRQDYRVRFYARGVDDGRIKLVSEQFSVPDPIVARQFRAFRILPGLDIRYHRPQGATPPPTSTINGPLGRLLLHILLVNRGQTAADVTRRASSMSPVSIAVDEPGLHPRNVFYDGDTLSLTKARLELWREILSFAARLYGEPAGGGDYVLLQQTVRNFLARLDTADDVAIDVNATDSATELRNVLADLIHDSAWIDRAEAAGLLGPHPIQRPTPTANSASPRLPPAKVPIDTRPVAPKPAATVPSMDDDLDKTIIVSRERVTAALKSGNPSSASPRETATPRVVEPQQPEPAGVDLDETVIIRRPPR